MAKTKKVVIEQKRQGPGIWVLIVLLIGLFMISSCVAVILTVTDSGDFESADANVAIIDVKGVIVGEQQGGFFSDGFAVSREIRRQIKSASEDDSIKAIVFEINSPGGGAVASDEIGAAVKKIEKPTVGWIRELGASGGYWIASATDHILANRMSITGSIGVISSYLEYPNLLTRFNISYNQLTSGKYKDTGIPYRHLEDDERALLQQKIDTIHFYFVEEVSSNRNLSLNETTRLATGEFYLGVEAIELGLVDELGGEEELKAYLEELLGEEPKFKRYHSEPSILEALSRIMYDHGFAIGKGQTSFLTENQMRITT